MKLPETVPLPLAINLASETDETPDGPVLVVTATICNEAGEPVSRGKMRFAEQTDLSPQDLVDAVARHIASEVCEALAVFGED